MRSLGLASDLLAMEGLSVVESHPNRIVLRTPEEPDFWWGNILIPRHPPEQPQSDFELFRREFPEARHVVIAWDEPDLDPLPLRSAWQPLGFGVEVSDVLARSGAPPAPDPPEGYILREFASDADWDGAFALGMQIAKEDGYDPATHAPFLRRRIAGRRQQVARGTLRWWGAFRDGQLAAAMGIATGRIEGVPIGRYQSVETAPEHRRQGLCSALLARAAEGALERESDARLVIVADADGVPGRLYRRAGFALVEQTVAVVRRPEVTP